LNEELKLMMRHFLVSKICIFHEMIKTLNSFVVVVKNDVFEAINSDIGDINMEIIMTTIEYVRHDEMRKCSSR